MAFATLKLWDDTSSVIVATTSHSSPDTNLTLVSQTENGSLYKDASRALSLPYTVEFKYKLGTPTALGNDKLIVKISNAVQDGGTGKTNVIQGTLELSVPRSAYVNAEAIKKVLRALTCVLGDEVRRDDFAAASAPSADLTPHSLD